MKVYGNHFQVDNNHNNLLVTYDYGVASIFQQSQGSEDEVLGAIQYVGTLKEILQLDYGLISSPLLHFNVNRWRMGHTIEGTQHIDEMMLDFFLPIFNTYCMINEPFVFLSQVQQVFLGVTLEHHGGRFFFTKNLGVNGSWQVCMMTTLRHMPLVLKPHYNLWM